MAATSPNAGDMNDSIWVQALEETAGADGSVAVRYEQPGRPWRAQIGVRSSQGREIIEAQAVASVVTFGVIMPRFPGLTSKHRIVTAMGNRILNIIAVFEVGNRGEWHELICGEAG